MMKKLILLLGLAGCVSQQPQLIGFTPGQNPKIESICLHYDENSDGVSDYYECREMLMYEGKIFLGKPYKTERTIK